MASSAWSAMVGVAVLLGSPAAAQEQEQEQEQEAVAAEEVAGDAAAGERVFRRCQACHMVGEGAENRVGPILNGVVGSPAGSVEGFEYSPEMLAAGEAGLVWTVADLQAYLERPGEKVPGNKMAFPGLRSEEQRSDVIAYIHEASTGNGGE